MLHSVVLASSLVSAAAHAEDYTGYKPLRPANGISSVDFTGDGVPDLIVSGFRNNYNAHSFEVVTFYVWVKDADGTQRLNLVPLFDAAGTEQTELRVSGGADCVLHDFRLLVGPRKDVATLVRADREMGKTFVDPASVTFTYFDLKTNASGMMAPTYYFGQVAVVKAKRNYCDVNDALSKEAAMSRRPDD